MSTGYGAHSGHSVEFIADVDEVSHSQHAYCFNYTCDANLLQLVHCTLDGIMQYYIVCSPSIMDVINNDCNVIACPGELAVSMHQRKSSN